MAGRRWGMVALALVLAWPILARPAGAEVSEIRIAYQFGLTYLPLIVAKHRQAIEQHAAAAGAGPLTVSWLRLGGGAAVNDALISGSADFASAGLGPFLTLWDKTRGSLDVKGVAALDASAVFLNTSNPKIKTLADFTDADRIALPAVKVSHQAVLLQMAAEQLYGPGQHGRFDPITVAMAHPDATAALLAGRTEIIAQFGNAPFIFQQLENPNIHKVISSEEILGGPSTITSIYTTSRFRTANPLVYRAVFEAVAQAQALIARDPAEAVRLYLAEDKSALKPEFLLKILADPGTRYGLAPLNTYKFADFMARTGALKKRPQSWRDYYFPELHD